MSIEVQAIGVRCNLSCSYCYQHPLRDGGNFGDGYDLAKIKAALLAEGGAFTLFGGEALLMPIGDLEELVRWGFETFGGSGVQTNATLITDEHIRIFNQYRVTVGVSMDGPADLNDSRWAGSIEKTREMTARSEAAIRKLVAAGIVPSLIVTLYRGNATGAALERLLAWFRELDALGLSSARLHLLEIDHDLVAETQALTLQETLTAIARVAALQGELAALRFDLFDDVRRRLSGDLAAGSCIWHGCDPFTTPAVRAVDGQGERANCGRTAKDGVNWIKAETASNERTLALYHTPYEHGGCGGCRFFFACQGQCPGTGLGGDWRNRSEQCDVVFGVFEILERELLAAGRTPLSLNATERRRLEAAVLQAGEGDSPHGDSPHGDIPHGDEHGDHTDQALARRPTFEECNAIRHHDSSEPCQVCGGGSR
jgi:uncharacterized protein